MGTAESKLPEPPVKAKSARSARVSLEYIEEDVQITLDQLIPKGLPSLWQHQWVKSYHDDHLLYCSVWDTRHPGKRKGVVVFVHGFGLHSHAYDIPFLKVLAKNDFVAFSFDRRGHGRTAKAPGPGKRFGDIGEDHRARLCDIASVIDAATHAFPGLPVFLAGHALGGAEVLAFLARWSKSSQARLVEGALLYAPGHGDAEFCKAKLPVHSVLKEVYPALVLTGHVTAQMIGSVDGMAPAVAAARKLFTRYSDSADGTLAFPMLERCLNTALKMDMEECDLRAIFDCMDPEGSSKIDMEEFILAVLLAGAPDDFVCTGKLLPTSLINLVPYLNGVLASRGSDIKPPLLWVHGPADRVNPMEWAESIVQQAASSDTTVKLHHGLRHGVFMDKDAPTVLEETIQWLNERASAGGGGANMDVGDVAGSSGGNGARATGGSKEEGAAAEIEEPSSIFSAFGL